MNAPRLLQHNRIQLALFDLAPGDGTARPLLLVHGLGMQSPTAVPDDCATWPGPVHAIDLTGHGASSPSDGGGYTAEALMGDVDAALAILGPCTVVGRGLGAYVALLIAGGRPELVRGAVLADGPGLAGGGSRPTSPTMIWPEPGAVGPPDPWALAELSRDPRPPDYATALARAAAQLSGLASPIAVCAGVTAEWIDAVAAEPGVLRCTVEEALAAYVDPEPRLSTCARPDLTSASSASVGLAPPSFLVDPRPTGRSGHDSLAGARSSLALTRRRRRAPTVRRMLRSVQVLQGHTLVARFGDVVLWLEPGTAAGGPVLPDLIAAAQAAASGTLAIAGLGQRLAALLTAGDPQWVPALVAVAPADRGLQLVVHGWGDVIGEGIRQTGGWSDQVVGWPSTLSFGRTGAPLGPPTIGSVLDLVNGVVHGLGASVILDPRPELQAPVAYAGPAGMPGPAPVAPLAPVAFQPEAFQPAPFQPEPFVAPPAPVPEPAPAFAPDLSLVAQPTPVLQVPAAPTAPTVDSSLLGQPTPVIIAAPEPPPGPDPALVGQPTAVIVAAPEPPPGPDPALVGQPTPVIVAAPVPPPLDPALVGQSTVVVQPPPEPTPLGTMPEPTPLGEQEPPLDAPSFQAPATAQPTFEQQPFEQPSFPAPVDQPSFTPFAAPAFDAPPVPAVPAFEAPPTEAAPSFQEPAIQPSPLFAPPPEPQPVAFEPPPFDPQPFEPAPFQPTSFEPPPFEAPAYQPAANEPASIEPPPLDPSLSAPPPSGPPAYVPPPSEPPAFAAPSFAAPPAFDEPAVGATVPAPVYEATPVEQPFQPPVAAPVFAAPAPSAPLSGPRFSASGKVLVLGSTCPQGHFCHPLARTCGTCGSPIAQPAALTEGERPPLGLLVLDDGKSASLAQDMLLGREPSDDPEVRSGRCRALTVADPTSAISRVHFEVDLVDWDVVIVDRGAGNGTYYLPPGAPAWEQVPVDGRVTIVGGTKVAFGPRQLTFESSHIL